MILKIECFYFDDKIKDIDIYSVDILLDKKPNETYENILIFSISYKTSTNPKPLHFSFNKIYGFIMVLDGEIKHLVLFDYGLFDKICERIKCLVSKKVVIQIVLMIVLEKSEVTHVILYPLKIYGLFINL